MGGKKVEGMQACQKNVFVWMPDEMIHTAEQTISADEVARQYGVPQETLIVYLGAEIQEAEACRSLPFTLMLVISYAAMAILHDDSPITRAVEDSLEYDIRYNTEFAFSTNGVIGTTSDLVGGTSKHKGVLCNLCFGPRGDGTS